MDGLHQPPSPARPAGQASGASSAFSPRDPPTPAPPPRHLTVNSVKVRKTEKAKCFSCFPIVFPIHYYDAISKLRSEDLLLDSKKLFGIKPHTPSPYNIDSFFLFSLLLQ